MPLDPTLSALGRRLGEQRQVAEANPQADIASLLRDGPFGLSGVELEYSIEGGRIDIQAGQTVIEVKADLDVANQREAGKNQLTRYLESVAASGRGSFVGILTDGRTWDLYRLVDGELALLATFRHEPTTESTERLIEWLQGVTALAEASIPATPESILARFGHDTPTYAIAMQQLARLWTEHRNTPSIKLKRELWAQMATMVFGTSFGDDDQLFLDHTYVVLVTKLIAHRLLDLDVATLAAEEIITGRRFRQAEVYDVVDSDLFEWCLEAGGAPLVDDLARRVQRFDFTHVDHDLLKALYEGVIPAETRHQLGEYYTPDWLAEMIVEKAITDPLNQHVLDPSCGSGTFVFHAVRRYLRAAQNAGVARLQYLQDVQHHVAGMDLHPVAVQLARVTWLLAIGVENLTSGERPPLRAPIFLGDSIQWQIGPTHQNGASFEIVAEPSQDLFTQGSERRLVFAMTLIDDISTFEELLASLEQLAHQPNETPLRPILTRLGIDTSHHEQLEADLQVLRRLEHEGRNHIWAYFIRNQVRPLYYQRNKVDVIVGNPPWLAYRYMAPKMQEAFQELVRYENMWVGGRLGTQQDLSAYFFTRVARKYLRDGGSIAMVMPYAVLTRPQYAPFRTGAMTSVNLAFSRPWDLRGVSELFPIPACVVYASRSGTPQPMPTDTDSFQGRLPKRNLSRAAARQCITQSHGYVVQISGDEHFASRYANSAHQGATVVPRRLWCVERLPSLGLLGTVSGTVRIRGVVSRLDKAPWNHLDPLEGVIEEEFLVPLVLGETLLPFRLGTAREMVLPFDSTRLLSAQAAFAQGKQHLADWLSRANALWEQHRSSDRLSLLERLDYHKGLTAQLAMPSGVRFVYPTSGSVLCGAVVTDSRAVIDTKAYWVPCGSLDEAQYLSAIFNTPSFTKYVNQYQSIGLFGSRDFHKYPFLIPIPEFDATKPLHLQLAGAGHRGEAIAASVDLSNVRGFQHARKQIRQALKEAGLLDELDGLVQELIPEVTE